MATSVLWHGSQTEALELLQALSRNCSCVVTAHPGPFGPDTQQAPVGG